MHQAENCSHNSRQKAKTLAVFNSCTIGTNPNRPHLTRVPVLTPSQKSNKEVKSLPWLETVEMAQMPRIINASSAFMITAIFLLGLDDKIGLAKVVFLLYGAGRVLL